MSSCVLYLGDEHSIKCISTASRTCRKIEELEGSTFDVSTTDMADLCDCHCNVGYYEANKTCIKSKSTTIQNKVLSNLK